jgi:hypothetical protein
MNDPNAPRGNEDMDELTAVRQLLAERPPPAPATVAAARASLERASLGEGGRNGEPGRVPLRLNGGWGVPDVGRPARRRRWWGWLAPLAAALAVIIAVGASLAISHTVGGQQGSKQADRATAAFAQVPHFFVALTGTALPDQGQHAEVVATATGKVLGSVTAPSPYRVFTWVAAARDDRTFVLGAQRARPVGGVLGQVMGVGAVKLYRLVLHRSGRPGALEPLRVPQVSGEINGFALSPDGSKLAVSAHGAPGAVAGSSQILVFALATGAERSWVLGNVGWVGQDKPSAESLAWAGDNRTLLFKEYLGKGGSAAEIRLLDTAAPGGFLAAASTRVPFPSSLISGRVEDPVQAYDTMLLTADGNKIITAVTRDTWRGRLGFPPDGMYGNTVRGLLPPQCRGTGRHLAKRTPYCAKRLNQVVSGGKNSPLGRITVRQLAEQGATVTFTVFSAATAQPVAALGGVQGNSNTWAEVTWASPDGAAMIIDGAWPKAGGGWPMSRGGPPMAVAGVMTGGTFTPFPKRVQSLYFHGQATW